MERKFTCNPTLRRGAIEDEKRYGQVQRMDGRTSTSNQQLLKSASKVTERNGGGDMGVKMVMMCK